MYLSLIKSHHRVIFTVEPLLNLAGNKPKPGHAHMFLTFQRKTKIFDYEIYGFADRPISLYGIGKNLYY